MFRHVHHWYRHMIGLIEIPLFVTRGVHGSALREGRHSTSCLTLFRNCQNPTLKRYLSFTKVVIQHLPRRRTWTTYLCLRNDWSYLSKTLRLLGLLETRLLSPGVTMRRDTLQCLPLPRARRPRITVRDAVRMVVKLIVYTTVLLVYVMCLMS